MSAELAPEWANGVPLCRETCPQHDGKRCRLMGLRPDRICEPAVQQMAAERDTARSERDSWKGRAQLWQHMCETDLKAAETGLASARELLGEASHYMPGEGAEVCGRMMDWLTSHPAPVAEEPEAPALRHSFISKRGQSPLEPVAAPCAGKGDR